jgi:hypothetical protein
MAHTYQLFGYLHHPRERPSDTNLDTNANDADDPRGPHLTLY